MTDIAERDSEGLEPSGDTSGPLRRRLAFPIVAALVALIGIIEWHRLPSAPLDSLNYDGFRYLAGSWSLLDHGRYIDIGGDPQRTWAPGTSLLYAVLARVTGKRPEQLVTFVGLMSYLAILFALAATMRTTIRRWPLAAIGLAAIALNSGIVSLTNKFLSEPAALAFLSWALLMAIDAIDKRSERRMVVAAFLFSLAIFFRFALIAAVPLALAAAFFASGRLRTLALALLTPLPMMIALRVLAPGAHTATPFRITPLPFAEDWKGLAELASQIVPTRMGWIGVVLFVILIVIVAGAAIRSAGWVGAERGRREIALLLHSGWIILYTVFLLVAQWIWVSPAPVIDLRMLLPLYPSIVIVLVTGADRLMDRGPRSLAALGVIAVSIATARALHPFFDHRPQPAPACISRYDAVLSIERLRPAILGDDVVTNAQGLAWYALRRPVGRIRDAKTGSLVIFVDGSKTCPYTVETIEVPRGGNIIARDGAVVIMRQ
ncbi:MAG: hypothetical protein QOK37_2022 [Thermoanaerobaculia bacterium]|nr:hypothetical protein [Thermoanaerobaculia bacterium]